MRKSLTPTKREMVKIESDHVPFKTDISPWNYANNKIGLQYQYVEVAIEKNLPLKVIDRKRNTYKTIEPADLTKYLQSVKGFEDKIIKGTFNYLYYYPLPSVFKRKVV